MGILILALPTFQGYYWDQKYRYGENTAYGRCQWEKLGK